MERGLLHPTSAPAGRDEESAGLVHRAWVSADQRNESGVERRGLTLPRQEPEVLVVREAFYTLHMPRS